MNIKSERKKLLYWLLIVHMERKHKLVWSPVGVIVLCHKIALCVIYDKKLNVWCSVI